MVLPSDGRAQEIVDELARRVAVPVLAEDPDERVIAYSAQDGPIDEVRRNCILSRAASPEVVAFFSRFDLATADGPFRTPSQPELGVLGRLCVPIRRGSRTLGYLWLIDDDARLGADDLELAVRAGERFAVLLHDLGLRARLHSETVAHLLSPSPELRDRAARDLVADGRWPATASCVVGVALLGRPVTGSGGGRARAGSASTLLPGGVSARSLLAEALERWRQRTWSDGILAHVEDDHLAVVSPGPPVGGGGGGITRSPAARPGGEWRREMLGLRRHVLEFLEESGPVGDRDGDLLGELAGDRPARPAGVGSSTAAVPALPVLVGLGDPQAGISAAAVSYRHAHLAAQVAGAVHGLGGVAAWSDLGAYRALVQLAPGEEGSDATDPRLEALLAAGRPELVDTLEVYLDRAGDVKATAEELVLHRGGLYHRLGRIEQITGCDLRDGADRLALHVGLRLARLQGRRDA